MSIYGVMVPKTYQPTVNGLETMDGRSNSGRGPAFGPYADGGTVIFV